jgi:phenylacetate-coenzyme A ligase PaaK-like adenylate-forming protein
VGVRPSDYCLVSGAEVLSFQGGGVPYVRSVRKIGAFIQVISVATPVLEFDTAVELEAQGILHTRWIYPQSPAYRWLIQKLENEDKNLKRDYFPELKCAVVANEQSKSLLDYGCKLFGVPIVNHTGMAELMFYINDCMYGWSEDEGARMHVHFPEDTHFIEIFPIGSYEPVKVVEFGEPVITNLFSECMAYIRFRSEDLVSEIRYDPCPYCGYTHMQYRPRSRVSESVTVKGKVITMSHIEDILYAYSELRPMPAQLIREEPQPQDKLRLRVSYKTDLVKEPEQFRLKLIDDFKDKLGVDAEIALISPEEVRAIYHKFERVIKEKRQS